MSPTQQYWSGISQRVVELHVSLHEGAAIAHSAELALSSDLPSRT